MTSQRLSNGYLRCIRLCAFLVAVIVPSASQKSLTHTAPSWKQSVVARRFVSLSFKRKWTFYEACLLLVRCCASPFMTRPPWSTWGEPKGCLMKGCLNSTEISKVGIPKPGISRTVIGENSHWNSPQDRDSQSQGFRSQGFRKQGFRSWGFRNWADSQSP